jgi:hypothetical protein
VLWPEDINEEKTGNPFWEVSGKPSLGTSKRWEDEINIDVSELRWEVDGTGSGSCPVAGFYITCVCDVKLNSVLLNSDNYISSVGFSKGKFT